MLLVLALSRRVRLPHVGIEASGRKAHGQDADDLFRTTVDHERRPDGVLRAAEHGLPEAMTDQDQRLPLGRFLARETASQQRLHSEEWKEVGRDAGAGDAVRALRSRQRHRHGIEGGDVREALALSPPLFDVLKRRSALANVPCRVLNPQHRQLFRRLIRNGLEQNGLHDAEHRGVGANRQRERGGGCDRKRRIAPEGAGRVPEILARLVEPCPDPDAPCVLFRERDIPKRQHRLTPRLGWRHAAVDVVLGLAVNVIANVLVESRQLSRVTHHGRPSPVAGARTPPMAWTSLSHLLISVSSCRRPLAVSR